MAKEGVITNGSIGVSRKARHGQVVMMVQSKLAVPLPVPLPLFSTRSEARSVVERISGGSRSGSRSGLGSENANKSEDRGQTAARQRYSRRRHGCCGWAAVGGFER